MPSSSSPLLQLGFPCEGKPSARDVLALSGNGHGLERELLSLQPGRWQESSPGACSRLGHPLLATKELRIAQSFPWCPLVISVYGL